VAGSRVSIDVTKCLALIAVAACGTPPKGPVASKPEPVTEVPVDAAPPPPDPDLNREPPKPLLSIDWATVPLATEAEANAAWVEIAPTGADWEEKLDEIPVAKAGPLAVAMLRAGNFTCVPPQPKRDCAPLVLDVDEPAPAATRSDPCLRRLLALWSLGAVEDADLPQIYPALKQIAAIPPPESQLVAAAIQAVPETDHDKRLELLSIAFQAGQRDLANGHVSTLDEAHLIDAARKHHIDGALDALAVASHRAVVLAAIADEQMSPKARAESIQELVAGEDKLAPDAKAALIAATKAKDCYVAAAAARALEVRGDTRAVPRRPRTRSTAVMMRALCVLAAYERFQGNDESSLLPAFVPASGLEHVKVAFDPLSDTDPDGDGDPHTERTVMQIPRSELVVPEVDDMVRAFRHCKGTTCSSDDRDFRFGLSLIRGELYLAKVELIDRPPCPGH
jgi:hypothetical protein